MLPAYLDEGTTALADVADIAGVSMRTLQRKLAHLGLTYSDRYPKRPDMRMRAGFCATPIAGSSMSPFPPATPTLRISAAPSAG